MVASLAMAPRLLYWTQAGIDRNLRARTCSCTRGRIATGRERNANGHGRVVYGHGLKTTLRGRVMMGADGL
jgi:hypothetical protein